MPLGRGGAPDARRVARALKAVLTTAASRLSGRRASGESGRRESREGWADRAPPRAEARWAALIWAGGRSPTAAPGPPSRSPASEGGRGQCSRVAAGPRPPPEPSEVRGAGAPCPAPVRGASCSPELVACARPATRLRWVREGRVVPRCWEGVSQCLEGRRGCRCLHPMGSRRRRGWVWAQRGRRRTARRPAGLSPQWSARPGDLWLLLGFGSPPWGQNGPAGCWGRASLGRLPRTPRRAALFAVLPPGRVVHRGAPRPCLATPRPHNRLVETVEWKE